MQNLNCQHQTLHIAIAEEPTNYLLFPLTKSLNHWEFRNVCSSSHFDSNCHMYSSH